MMNNLMNSIVEAISKIAFIAVAVLVIFLGVTILKKYSEEHSNDDDYLKKVFIIFMVTLVIALILANIAMFAIQAMLL